MFNNKHIENEEYTFVADNNHLILFREKSETEFFEAKVLTMKTVEELKALMKKNGYIELWENNSELISSVPFIVVRYFIGILTEVSINENSVKFKIYHSSLTMPVTGEIKLTKEYLNDFKNGFDREYARYEVDEEKPFYTLYDNEAEIIIKTFVSKEKAMVVCELLKLDDIEMKKIEKEW